MANPSTRFSRLRIQGWRQFDSVDITLHDRLTVLTGANGAGKTSLLQIFSRHIGFSRPYFATPRFDSNGTFAYLTGQFAAFFRRNLFLEKTENQVGVLTYSNGAEASLELPNTTGAPQYQLQIKGQQPIEGVHIDSLSPISNYQPVTSIPMHIVTPGQAYSTYNSEVVNKYQGGHTGSSPMYRMKESLIAMATFGEGNRYVKGNRPVLDAYLGFIDILRKVLPEQVGFQALEIRPPEIVVVTQSGEFMLDASSGGLITLIDVAWRLFMFSREHKRFVVTMDEPENHLHPSMQRSLMPRLLEAFPDVQFIIATHSPFMVTAVRDSNVYVLRFVSGDLQGVSQRRVTSEKLDAINKAGSAGEVLREVLGVPATTPEWVEKELDEIVARYRQRDITVPTLKELRQELSSRGYTELYPDALAAITDGQ